MMYETIKTKLEKEFPGIKCRIVRKSLLLEDARDLPKVAGFLKKHEDYRLDYLSSLTGVDYLNYLEAVYHLYSMEKKRAGIQLRVRTDRDEAKLPSLVSVYRGAEFQEREAYDMFGIHFEGHPDLRRIFMWEGFAGYPMRKDYEQEDSETLEMEDVAWLEERGVAVPEDARKKAQELKAQGKRAVASKELPDKKR